MGDNSINKENSLKPYQVNRELIKKARKDAVFMHCLPAHRGKEVTSEVIDSNQSIVFAGAENRLHVQRSIIWWCLKNDEGHEDSLHLQYACQGSGRLGYRNLWLWDGSLHWRLILPVCVPLISVVLPSAFVGLLYGACPGVVEKPLLE